jgi:CRISPR-associated protein Csd1
MQRSWTKGGQIFFEQLKSEIIDKIPATGFPAHLSLQDQGRFMVGYYQQRQEFYTKKEKTEDNNVEQ